MATLPKAVDAQANRLLGLLSFKDYRRLQPHLRRVPLGYRQSLYRAHRRLGYVYFIETGVGSLVNTMASGQAAEVGTIGNEGMVGLPLLLGGDRGPTNVYVQVPGTGLRMTAARFSAEMARSASMRTVMLRYAHALFNQVAQSAACNHFHTLQQRCCRWMLMTHDRMQSDQFLLTQEFLAMMLGVQRTGVSAAAGALQRAGLIRYNRGIVTILDRRGLRKRACECYSVSKGEFDRLLGEPPRRDADRARRVPAMLNAVLLPLRRHYALRRFWNSARGFWHGPTARLAWKLIALLIAVIVLQILVRYRLNLWNRDFFDALEFLGGGEIWHQIQLLVLFAAVSMVLTVLAVGRMTFHCSRRGWGSRHRIGAWLSGERYRRINLWNGGHRNARYRIAEDARLATDPPNCVQGTMLLGDATRAAAFVALQGGG